MSTKDFKVNNLFNFDSITFNLNLYYEPISKVFVWIVNCIVRIY
jgi:hypothetical protein